MLIFNKQKKAISALVAMTFTFSLPVYGLVSTLSMNNASATATQEAPQPGKNIPKDKPWGTDNSGSASGSGGGNNGNSGGSMNDALIAAGINMTGGGIPISGNVRYSFMPSDGISSGRATTVCIPGNSEARNVAVNDNAKYNCFTWVKGGFAVPPMTTIEVSPRKSGKGSESTSVPYTYWEGEKDSRVQKWGNQQITISYNAYDAKNTMADTLAGFSTPTTTVLPGPTEEGKTPEEGGGDGHLCNDGTYLCYSTGGGGKGGEGGGSGGEGGGSGGEGGGSGGGSGSGGSGSGGSGSGTDYKDLLNDLLNDSDKSFNSGDSDWANSNADGATDIDDYFNGLGDEEGLPDGLTDDVLGVDGNLDALGLTGEDTDGDGVLDTFTDVDGNVMDINGAAEYMANAQENSDSDFYSGDANERDYEGDSFSDWLAKFGLDGLGDGTLGSLTDGDGNDSLAKRISDFVNGATSNAETGDKSTISEQEMYDLAKKMLLANGLTLDDIKKGKNYDKNSAYTEPASAWNMNRITTLLKEKKIKLESKDDVKKATNNNTLSNASEKDKKITQENKAKAENKK